MKDYEKDLQLRQYVPILKDAQRYPVIRDSKGVVLSMPPIINGRSHAPVFDGNLFWDHIPYGPISDITRLRQPNLLSR
jgi:hypothetical protein